MTRPGARGVQKRPSGATRAIHHWFGQLLNVVGVVHLPVRNQVDQSAPPATDPEHAITFAQRTHGDGADRRIQSRNVAAARQDRDRTLVRLGHVTASSLLDTCRSRSVSGETYRMTTSFIALSPSSPNYTYPVIPAKAGIQIRIPGGDGAPPTRG